MIKLGIFVIAAVLVGGLLGCVGGGGNGGDGSYTLIVDFTTGGTVAVDDVPIPGRAILTYDVGTVVRLNATPNAGYRFVNWTGNVSTIVDVNAATTDITIYSDYLIIANFEPKPELNLTYAVVDTGQEKCYDNYQEVACPQPGEAFYGQDAQYQGIQPAYQDNGDGTITDLNTGLMWQKTPDDKVTYDQAVAGADDFNLAGYDDWRLPTIKELYSLMLFSGTDLPPESVEPAVPFIDTNYFDFEYGDISAGERIIDAQYWSSTEYVGTTMNGAATVFGVNFADGRIKGYPRDTGPQGQPMTEFVRYVRGNLSYGVNNFADNGDGTITDNATGLTWSKYDSGEGMDWEDALAWVQQKNDESYLGYDDWRLPNAKELQSIVDYTRSPQTTDSAAIDPSFEVTSIIDERGEINYPFYWTSTTHVDATGGGRAAVYITFGEALGYMGNSWIDVHGAGAQRSDPKTGDPADYPYGRGPQGDAIRIYNYVRCVRDYG